MADRTVDFDARDYDRGVKRLAKDFRRTLRLALDTANIEATKLFDEQFRSDVQSIMQVLSYGYESANGIGLLRSSAKPPHSEQAFFLFHEALNLVLVALRTIRGGSVVAGDGILRQSLELACVAYQIAADDSGETLKQFLDGRLHAPRSITTAKRVYAPIGRLYGDLSNSAVHASTEHSQNSVVAAPLMGKSGRINVGASFTRSRAWRFKLGLIRIERVAVAVVALTEAGLADFVEKPHFWERTHSELRWSPDAHVAARLQRADAEQKAIKQPYLTLYPWVEPSDSDETRRLLGTTSGREIGDIERLRAVCSENPGSFVAQYLLGAALYAGRDLQGAAAQFERAWKLRRRGYDVWSRLEEIYGASDLDLLENFYLRSLEVDSEDYVAVHNLGMLYARTDRLEKAFDCFQRAHKLRPERYQAVYNGANALLRLRRYTEAVACYKHAAERDPSNPDPWHSAGVAHVRAGDLGSAYRCFRKAVQLDPGYVASWANLAVICRELGMSGRAHACAKRAQMLAPGDRRIATLVGADSNAPPLSAESIPDGTP